MAPKGRKNKKKREDLADKYKINEEIRASEIRLVGDFAENKNQVLSLDEALKIAEENELDLVMINGNAKPPVCKILDFQKFIYEEKKKIKEQRKNADKVEVKEIKFTPMTDDHDYEFKLRHSINFLEQGKKVKAFVFFKGRMITRKAKGMELLERFIKDLEEYGFPEGAPKMEGRRMTVIIAPYKGKHKKPKTKENAES